VNTASGQSSAADVSAFPDMHVSAFGVVTGQQMLTLSRRIQHALDGQTARPYRIVLGPMGSAFRDTTQGSTFGRLCFVCRRRHGEGGLLDKAQCFSSYKLPNDAGKDSKSQRFWGESGSFQAPGYRLRVMHSGNFLRVVD